MESSVPFNLEARYHIISENGKLILGHHKHPDGALEAITRDHFSMSKLWMANVIFRRDAKGHFGFEVNSGGALHLKLRKLEG